MIKTLFINICVLVISFSCYSQNLDSIINLAKAQYDKVSNFKKTLRYTVYTDSISEVKKEELNGELIKSGQNYYFKLKETEFLFSKTFSLKVNHIQKAMIFSKEQNNFETSLNEQVPFLALIKNFNSNKVIDMTNSWKCVLSDPRNISPYSKIIFFISKNNYAVTKQVYFFSSSMEKKLNPEMENTKNERFEIVETNFQKDPKIDESLFNLEKYIQVKNNNYVPSEPLKTYKVFVQ
ncbi:hypothetical protein [Psychroserpens mesophilus]|uniref:hypothetical protein n=1 Tax=Psychroserpens mesophilus TaxID=325473 RepID=UPI00058D8EA4|nr:hypothetical protein [Psychroserpens mesophilus]